MYKLYLDKPTNFECTVQLEGASLKDASARLVIEGAGDIYLFEGKLSSNGKCTIPVAKLKNKLEEGHVGKMRLEIIAEDTYFQPWSSEYSVGLAKKAIVEIMSQQSTAPRSMSVSVHNPEETRMTEFVNNIVSPLKNKGFTIESLSDKRQKRIVVEFIKRKMENQLYDHNTIIQRVVTELAR